MSEAPSVMGVFVDRRPRVARSGQRPVSVRDPPRTAGGYRCVICGSPDTVGDMEVVLWQVLAATRGGPNRARILRALDERPRNANRLADDLDLAYNTVRHHLDVLEEHDIVTSGDESYGTVYLPSERTRNNWDTVDDILTNLRE